MDRIINPRKWHDFLRRVHKYVKEGENNQISRTKLSQKMNNHTLLDSALLKLAEDKYINREERIAPGSKTGKLSVWYVWLKDLPFNLGVENLTPSESALKAPPVPLIDKLTGLKDLSDKELEKKAEEWVKKQPHMISLLIQALYESLDPQKLIDLSENLKLNKIVELINTQQMLNGKIFNNNNFTLIMIENASKALFDKSKEVNVEPTNLEVKCF